MVLKLASSVNHSQRLHDWQSLQYKKICSSSKPSYISMTSHHIRIISGSYPIMFNHRHGICSLVYVTTWDMTITWWVIVGQSFWNTLIDLHWSLSSSYSNLYEHFRTKLQDFIKCNGRSTSSCSFSPKLVAQVAKKIIAENIYVSASLQKLPLAF